jgi:hypothetical protein
MYAELQSVAPAAAAIAAVWVHEANSVSASGNMNMTRFVKTCYGVYGLEFRVRV